MHLDNEFIAAIKSITKHRRETEEILFELSVRNRGNANFWFKSQLRKLGLSGFNDSEALLKFLPACFYD